MCPSGKRAYVSGQQAYRALRLTTARRRAWHQRTTEHAAYRCPACGAWHLTHHRSRS